MYQVTYVHTWRDIKIKKKEKKKEIYILVFLVEEDFGVDAATTTPPERPHRGQIPVHALPVLPALNSRHAARSVRTTRK
jgi:hypothetical protein